MNYIKKAVALVSVIALALGFVSCQKCVTCNILDKDGAILYPGTNVCGKKSVIDDYKLAAEQTAAQYEGGKADCTDN